MAMPVPRRLAERFDTIARLRLSAEASFRIGLALKGPRRIGSHSICSKRGPTGHGKKLSREMAYNWTA